MVSFVKAKCLFLVLLISLLCSFIRLGVIFLNVVASFEDG
jgi:hypothetical protein